MDKNSKFGKLFAPETEWKVVEKKKYYFIGSAIFFAIALIIFLIFSVKLGIDFQGGYVLEVEYRANLVTEENREAKAKELENIIEGLKDDNGNPYGIIIQTYAFQGEGSVRSFRFRFLPIGNNEYMDVEMPKIEEKLLNAIREEDAKYLVSVRQADRTSPTVSSELVLSAVLAVVISIAAMLIYVSFRFEITSAIAAIVALLHDVLFMFAFMAISRIELSSTFMAALVTIIGYSINNTLVMFDRVREMNADPDNKGKSPSVIINQSIKSMFTRMLYTSITTIVSILLLAIIGVPSIKIFTIPILAGLIAGTYSTVFIASSVWVVIKDYQLKKGKHIREKKIAYEKTVKKADTNEANKSTAE